MQFKVHLLLYKLTATKGSFPRRPKMNQEVPHKNTNKDKKNGMNSTLFVLITNLCIFSIICQKTLLIEYGKRKRERGWGAHNDC